MQRATIQAGDRVALFGKTGTGKTTLARSMLARIPRLVVCDIKGKLTDWGLGNFDYDGRREFRKTGQGRLRAAVPIGEDVGEFWDTVFDFAFEQGDLIIYIDEISGIAPPQTKFPTMMHAAYTRGREFNIGIWGAAQRPSSIPLFTITESEHFFVFRLQLKEDRQRIAQILGETILEPVKHPHGFYYFYQDWETPIYVRQLNFTGKGQGNVSQNNPDSSNSPGGRG